MNINILALLVYADVRMPECTPATMASKQNPDDPM